MVFPVGGAWGERSAKPQRAGMGPTMAAGKWQLTAFSTDVITQHEVERLIEATLAITEASRFTHGRPVLTFQVLGLPASDEGIFDFEAFAVSLFPRPADAIVAKLEPEAEFPLYVADLAGSADEYLRFLVVHELGHLVHCVLQRRQDEQGRAWRALWTACLRHADRKSCHPSAYTVLHRNKKQEYFAEVFALYHLRPDRLRATDPAGYNLVRKAYEICPIPDVGGF